MRDSLDTIRGYGELLDGVSFDVVNLHPLADETDVLGRLEMAPEDCQGCDLYWSVQGQVVFVSIASRADEEPFVKSWPVDTGVARYSFVVSTRASPLKKSNIERVLMFLATWMARNHALLGTLNEKEVRLTDSDVGITSS